MLSFKERYLKAVSIAAEAHYGQFRSGTDDLPYLTHPLAVAAIAEKYELSEDQILALVTHDVLEDGGDPKRYAAKIKIQLGEDVLRIVEGLTDPDFPEGTLRKEKKKVINERLSQLPFDVQMAKLCDVFHNTQDIGDKKPKFAKKYLAEKMDQLECLSSLVKDTQLYKDVYSQIKQRTLEVSHGSSLTP